MKTVGFSSYKMPVYGQKIIVRPNSSREGGDVKNRPCVCISDTKSFIQGYAAGIVCLPITTSRNSIWSIPIARDDKTSNTIKISFINPIYMMPLKTGQGDDFYLTTEIIDPEVMELIDKFLKCRLTPYTKNKTKKINKLLKLYANYWTRFCEDYGIDINYAGVEKTEVHSNLTIEILDHRQPVIGSEYISMVPADAEIPEIFLGDPVERYKNDVEEDEDEDIQEDEIEYDSDSLSYQKVPEKKKFITLDESRNDNTTTVWTDRNSKNFNSFPKITISTSNNSEKENDTAVDIPTRGRKEWSRFELIELFKTLKYVVEEGVNPDQYLARFGITPENYEQTLYRTRKLLINKYNIPEAIYKVPHGKNPYLPKNYSRWSK